MNTSTRWPCGCEFAVRVVCTKHCGGHPIPEPRIPNDATLVSYSELDEKRRTVAMSMLERGWSSFVSDYSMTEGGNRRTLWVFTKRGSSIFGEGQGDDEALAMARSGIEHLEAAWQGLPEEGERKMSVIPYTHGHVPSPSIQYGGTIFGVRIYVADAGTLYGGRRPTEVLSAVREHADRVRADSRAECALVLSTTEWSTLKSELGT